MRRLMEFWDSLWERPIEQPGPLGATLAGELGELAHHLERTSRLMQRHISVARQVDRTQGEIESVKLRCERLEIRLQALEDLVQSERKTKEVAPVREFAVESRRPAGRWGGQGAWRPRPGN